MRRRTMARRVFFSFHYQRDVWRANTIRNLGIVDARAAAGWTDASLWEEAKKKGDASIKKLIDDALVGTSVTVVLIGAQTAGRKYINYEIQQSIDRGNGILGVHIHGIKNQDKETDTKGDVPAKLVNGDYKVYSAFDKDKFSAWVEAAAKDAGK